MFLVRRVFNIAYVVIEIADYILGLPNFAFFTLKL